MWRSTSRSRAVSWSSSGSTSAGVSEANASSTKPGQPRREDRVAVGDPAHRVGQLGAGDRLGHVAARAGADDRDHVLGRVGDAESARKRWAGSALGHLADHLEAAAARHVDVEQDDVGLELDDAADRVLDARGVAEHVDQAVELGAHAGAEQRVVVDDARRSSRLHHQLDLRPVARRAVDRRAAAVAFHARDDRVAHAAAVRRHRVGVEARPAVAHEDLGAAVLDLGVERDRLRARRTWTR